MPDVRRGEFMTLLGGAAGWPLAAWAQQPAVPMVGFLDPRSLENECKASSARIPARPQGYRLSHGENHAINANVLRYSTKIELDSRLSWIVMSE